MALTGLKIQKLLPKTNCKECGSNTCLAFAMKLAAKKANLADCPYASDEAKAVLGAASEPPVKVIELGADKSLKLGDETVLYRHEKTFANQTAFAVNINDTNSSEDIEKSLNQIKDYLVERVGEELKIDLVSITQKSDNQNTFVSVVKKVFETTKIPLIVQSSNMNSLKAASEVVKGSNSILASAIPENVDEMVTIAKESELILAVTAQDLNQLAKLTSTVKENGFNNLILLFQTHSLAEKFQTNTISRRAAIRDNYKPLGYPSLTFLDSDDEIDDMLIAINEICKYGGICVFPKFDPAVISTLMTLRMNIYTDPQKPIQVEPGIYPIGEPKPESPVFVTTNFSLTYFIVSGEIENSGTSAWLLVPECEGMSVLTAWAAGKFSGAQIGKFAKDINLEDQVSARDIIIPGYVAQISGELEENMPGWKVMVGPQESADLESFIKNRLN